MLTVARRWNGNVPVTEQSLDTYCSPRGLNSARNVRACRRRLDFSATEEEETRKCMQVVLAGGEGGGMRGTRELWYAGSTTSAIVKVLVNLVTKRSSGV